MKRKIITDNHFGELTVSKDKHSQNYYLEKKIELPRFREVYLYLENTKPEATFQQFELYTFILENIQELLITSEAFYYDSYKTSLYTEYEIDSILINETWDVFEWQLSLVKKKRFEHCVIDFNRLIPTHISFNA